MASTSLLIRVLAVSRADRSHSMFITQLLGAWLYFYNQEWYYAWMAVTKQHFALLIVTMQQWWAPIKVRLSWDSSMRGQFRKTEDGRLETDFPERIVLIANHQVCLYWWPRSNFSGMNHFC